MEPPIACLRLFLAQDPLPHSTGLADYSEWAREANENQPPGWGRVTEDPKQIRMALRASWESCLAVARNEKTLAAAQAQTLEEHLSETGPLVGQVLQA